LKEKKNEGSILSQWKSRQQNSPAETISKVAERDGLRLSHGQQRLWLLQQLHPENPFYNYSEAYHFKGNLQIQKLFQALQLIYDSHDILRTFYKTENGEPIAVVGAKEKLHIGEYDISAEVNTGDQSRIDKILLTDSVRPFDLENGPVIRFSLYKLSKTRHILLLNLHHIATDKWSMGIFRAQLAKYYRAFLENEDIEPEILPIQYQDYASWQRKTEIDQGRMDYWVEKLSGEIPSLELPKNNKPPSNRSFKGRFNRFSFSETLSRDILKLCGDLGTTPYVLLLSVYYVLLYRYSGQKDILIGSPISNRNHPALEKLIGFFNDTVVLRTTFENEISFVALVKKVQKTTFDAFANKDVAFEDLVRAIQPERSANTNPFFNVMFLYHSVPKPPDFGPNLEFSQDVFDTKVAKFDLTLYISEKNGLLTSIFEYATDIFDERTIERLQEHFALLLKGVVKNPQESISRIRMRTVFEETLFLEKNQETDTAELTVSGIHELINQAAQRYPKKSAVTFKEDSISYQELEKRANLVAHEITQLKDGSNATVGLCMERSVDMIVGLLGILKAGCAYLPLDPEYPKDRIQYMLEDSKVTLVVVNEATLKWANDFVDNEILNISKIRNEVERTETNLPKVKESDRAYIIYTSGTSGKPKGVPITHKNIINSTLGRSEFYKNDPTAFLLMSSISFDSSKAGLFWTLCTAGNLVISEKRLEQDVHRLAEVIEANQISHTLMLPTLYKMVLEHVEPEKLSSLKTSVVAGEACSTDLCAKHFEILPTSDLYNEYGPTEATVWCIAHKIEPKDIKSAIPIGKPVANAKIYLLDENLGLMPFGAIGQIYIGGPGLSGTYINRPDLTNSAYVRNPYDSHPDSKLYKTGDMGRYNSEGNIEFLGRADEQVKIRGFRIELEEIENTISENENVFEAVVLVEQSVIGAQKKLRAFLRTDGEFKMDVLKINLRKSLPEYMVPSTFMILNAFPHLPNGKVDKKSLSEIEQAEISKELVANDLPKNEKEKKLKEIWEEVLNLSQIGINDNFFEIGGDSISSIQIVAKSRAAGIPLKPNQIFENQTIAELALFVDESHSDILVDETITGEVQLTPIQHWFFDIHRLAPNYWNQMVSVAGIEAISIDTLKAVLLNLVNYHDALRLSFHNNNESWKAIVLSPNEVQAFYHFDFSNSVGKEAQEAKIKEQLISTQQSLDLSKGGLFVGVYFDCGEVQENRFVLIAHHLVIDMVSWNSLFVDIQEGIEQLAKNEAIKFKPKTISIRKWAEQLTKLSKSSELKAEEAYWRSQQIENKLLPADFKVDKSVYSESNIVVLENIIGSEITSKLQNEANDAYNTKIEDLLISALCDTITDWSNTDEFLLGLERHGRNSELIDLDVSNTVGWFTSFFPVAIKLPASSDQGKRLVSVKEQLRAIPNDGIGYGILKYLKNMDLFESVSDEPQVIFNYLGIQNKYTKTSQIDFEYLWEGARNPMSERTYGLEVNAFVVNGVLQLNWSYCSELYKKSTIERLVSDFEDTLTSLVTHCCSTEDNNYTPSDFPEADLSQDDLDNLMKQFE